MIFDNMLERLKFSLTNLTNIKEKELLKLKNSYVLRNPYQILDKKSNKYLQIVSKLETLSPLLTLKRGYTMTKVNDKVISSSKSINRGDIITIEFSDGKVDASVL
jgi:exodeoxyribonuclease VII large subunit